MNPEIKERWVKALRSGEYPQTTGKLRDVEGFCCLGVLCDIAAKDGVGEGWSFFQGYRMLHTFDGEMDVLPKSVLEWSGLYQDSVSKSVEISYVVDIRDVDTNLAEVNDDGASFPEIASLIEEQL